MMTKFLFNKNPNQNDSENILPQNDYQTVPRPKRIKKVNPKLYGEAWMNDEGLEKDQICPSYDFEYTERPRRTDEPRKIISDFTEKTG